MITPRLFLPVPQHWTKQIDVTGCFVTRIPEGSLRVFWDGGLTRDFPRPLWDCGKDVANGLYDERGNAVDVPESFLNDLPCMPLDGYLTEEDGRHVLLVIGMPNSNEFMRVGDFLAGDRLLRLEPDAAFDVCTNSMVAGDWRQAPPSLVFTNEMFHAMEALTGDTARVALFKEVKETDTFSHNESERYLFRAPGSVWAGGFMESWVEINPFQFIMTRVTKVDGLRVLTPHGAFNYSDAAILPRVGQDVLAFVNRFGFVTGLEPIWSN